MRRALTGLNTSSKVDWASRRTHAVIFSRNALLSLILFGNIFCNSSPAFCENISGSEVSSLVHKRLFISKTIRGWLDFQNVSGTIIWSRHGQKVSINELSRLNLDVTVNTQNRDQMHGLFDRILTVCNDGSYGIGWGGINRVTVANTGPTHYSFTERMYRDNLAEDGPLVAQGGSGSGSSFTAPALLPAPAPRATQVPLSIEVPRDSAIPLTTIPTERISTTRLSRDYLEDAERRVRSAWFTPRDVMPRKTIVICRVASSGAISELKLSNSCGSAIFDNNCMTAVENAAPFRPIPGAQSGRALEFRFAYDFAYIPDDTDTNVPFESSITVAEVVKEQ